MSDAVNWNNSPDECRLLTEADNSCGFFLEVDGEIAGSAGMVTYEPQSLVFINLVIVKEQYRRCGYATRLVEHILERTAGYKTKKLHATPEGSKVYAPLGFKPCRSISFFSAAAPLLDAPLLPGIHAMSADELKLAVERDKECFGFFRHNLLKACYRFHPELALSAGDGKSHIFGRRWKKFRQLSALAADDLNMAMALTARAAELDRSQPLSIITYDQQKDFQDFLVKGNFARTREMLDMELGENTPAPPDFYRAIYGGDMG